jgi:hypothetical protein
MRPATDIELSESKGGRGRIQGTRLSAYPDAPSLGIREGLPEAVLRQLEHSGSLRSRIKG